MKGILLAGGYGSRLSPATIAVSKQLLPIFDKPMIYYSLSVLMLAQVREILIISQSEYLPAYKKLLGSGERFGIKLEYLPQDTPKGIAEAFIIGEKFLENDSVCLILGDNLFYGQGFSTIIRDARERLVGATIFAHPVGNPAEFGVVSLDPLGNPIDIVEKPEKFASNLAVTGLYFYENSVVDVARNAKPSKRGELEITDINRWYLQRRLLSVKQLGRGFAWLDTGRPKSLLDASHFIETVESRQGYKVACLEEIAFSNGWIDQQIILDAVKRYSNSEYSKYLQSLLR